MSEQTTMMTEARAPLGGAHEYFPTPRLLVRAVLEQLLRWRDGGGVVRGCHLAVFPMPARLARPLRVVDVGCGSGVWASEVRRMFAPLGVPLHITGIDDRPEVREHAERWCDEVVIADFRDALAGRRDAWDLLVSNPPFTGVRELVPLALEAATASIILHTEQALTRSLPAFRMVNATPPRAELRLQGSISFTGGGADSRGYSVTTWQRGSTPGAWWETRCIELPLAARRWRERPGEEADDTLPTAPGWTRSR